MPWKTTNIYSLLPKTEKRGTPLRGRMMPESTLRKALSSDIAHTSSGKMLILLSKDLEDATNLFFMKIEELEKLLPLIDE